jgi:glycosyltransferase involved in cell wall biosynthesis
MSSVQQERARVLFIEPYHGGSHASFLSTLTRRVDAEWTTLTLPGRHWKWRARGSAVWFAETERAVLDAEYDLVIASSYLPLTELLGFAPLLSRSRLALYFHENQFAYPVRPGFERPSDHFFGFSQLVSALSANLCLFNSRWNLESFLEGGADLLKRMPDAVPSGWVETVRGRSQVLPLPLELPELSDDFFIESSAARSEGPIILWNHRWEFDKAPEAFFSALRTLMERGVPFRVAVCGERFRKAPSVFEEARGWLGDRVIHWGYCEDRVDYEALMGSAHIVVSTAIHEFFGISMLEAAHFGAYPLAPARLAYPEHFPPAHLYADEAELLQRLEELCRGWVTDSVQLRADRSALTSPYGGSLLQRYQALVNGEDLSGEP